MQLIIIELFDLVFYHFHYSNYFHCFNPNFAGGRLFLTLIPPPLIFFSLHCLVLSYKVDGSAQKLGVCLFPDPVIHFGEPWRPF